jgi:hypothetical protein
MSLRHNWGHGCYSNQGQRYWRCQNAGCRVWKDNYQLPHGAWETRYHLPSGHVLVRRAPPCMGLSPSRATGQAPMGA